MMADLPAAHTLRRAGMWANAFDQVVLTYDERFLRRKRLVTVGDAGFLVSLDETISVAHGDAFELDDGRLIAVVAAEEPVLVVTGDLPRLAWHIGNRHTPCQIEAGRLLIRQDHVLEAMLRQMGASVSHRMEAFTPEGGAYGHGRTMGHSHGDYDHAAFPFLNHAAKR
jgi:urease accessory protein